eukprot:4308652-Pyramimonas_sp.AAC.1
MEFVAARLGVSFNIEMRDAHSRIEDGSDSRHHTPHKRISCTLEANISRGSGQVPDRSIDQLLLSANILVPLDDLRRLDIIMS